MRSVVRLLLLAAATAAFISSGLVSYSGETECPEMENKPIDEAAFLSAHGLTQGNFSIWLKEHSVWQREYSTELKNYTFIPQPGYDTGRKK